mgnify:CR=1 FL=1
MTQWLKMLAVAGIVAITCSCKDQRVYDHFEHTSIDGWERNDTLSFNIPPMPEGDYLLNIGMRANVDYPYTKISVLMERTIYPSKKSHRDTIRCRLMEENGKMSGKQGISSSETRYEVSTIHLKDNDSLHIILHHCMSKEHLPGISEVGIQLVRKQ